MPALPARAASAARRKRRRIAARRRRLASRKADLALGHREARHAIEEADNLLAFVAEVFRDGERQPRGAAATRRSLVRRRRDDHGFLQAFGAQRILDEFRTSRPRSPIRPIDDDVRIAPRASIDMMVDLPTPDPAKMPRRWPRAHGANTSMAFTPSDIFWSTRARTCALGAIARTGRGRQPAGSAPFPSSGSAKASITRPSQPSDGRTVSRPEVKVNRRARPQAVERIAGQKNGAIALETHEFAARAVFVAETNRSAQSKGLGGAGDLDPQALQGGHAAFMAAGLEGLQVADGRGQHE